MSVKMKIDMTKPFLRSGVDSLDSEFKPSEVLIQQIETNREFIEHMLVKPEGEAVHTTKEGNNDD
ncbi:hypothetical protein HYQ36_gp058 [Salmonella phage moki]|uniref:Uncharacterized protein n=1 Tax=Salmonella phage moki TaxID=2713306 RepID=A0A6G9LBC2_9CAUD|nr:hypothetical protein HYQ36_gp058 [Salmonella phage moki]QIQ62331.1 hypothetical protein moki_58 [Salmonella phage moki]